MKQEQALPNNADSEKVLLASMMTYPGAYSDVKELVSEEVFYQDRHKEVFRAMERIIKRGDRPDLIIVLDELQKAGSQVTPYALAEMLGHSSPTYAQHAALLFDKYKRRQFFELGAYLQKNCFSEEEDVLDVFTEARKRLDGLFCADSKHVHTVRDAIDGVYENINRNLSAGAALTGFPTGFSAFDKRSGGLQPSDLIVLAAATSAGKTSLAIKMAMSAGCPVAFYSMEMKKEQVAARMIAMESGIQASDILYSKLGSMALQMVDKGVARIMDLPIYFDDRSGSSIDSILASIRSMKAKHGIRGAVVDYLQILNVNMGERMNREQYMGDVSRKLKNIAKELDIWVLALSQLNRDKDNPVPSLARLRDSGQIAEAADTVMLIYRPELYDDRYPAPYHETSTKGTAMIDVAKGRNIGLMKFIVGFDSRTTGFHEIEPAKIKSEDGEEMPF